MTSQCVPDSNGIPGFQDQIRSESAKLRIIFSIRIFLFIFLVIVFLLSIQNRPLIAVSSLIITVAAFLMMLKQETKTERRISYLKNRILILNNEHALQNKEYEQFNEGREFIDKQHDFISDLDIFGRRSVFQMLNRTATFTGKRNLAEWLITPLRETETILRRQEAVKELSRKHEWCENFLALAYENREEAVDKEVIREWLGEGDRFSDSFYQAITILLPGLCLLTLGGYLSGLIGYGAFQLVILLEIVVSLGAARTITRIHDKLGKKFSSIEKYKNLIAQIETEQFESGLLQELKQSLSDGKAEAGVVIHQLKRKVNALDARMNMIMAIVLNGMLLWDIQVVMRIERWRRAHKQHFLEWVDIVGEFDALISLGLFAHNNPGYAFPAPAQDSACISARELGHPLIPEERLVRNAYVLEGSPAIDLLTGANMAGKSTFLRTLGVNLVLAMIGAPVCAAEFRFRPMKLFTSLRTADSLQENESFFYAELRRLHKLIVYYESEEQVFFLLDEILKGTNSKDQHSGSEALIRKILRLKGLGIVATHDVELSSLSLAFPDNVRNLCFEISILDDKLSFDYTLRSGVCRTMNASYLMKRMGITDGEDPQIS